MGRIVVDGRPRVWTAVLDKRLPLSQRDGSNTKRRPRLTASGKHTDWARLRQTTALYQGRGTSNPELPISSCLGPSNAPSSTRAIVVSLTDAVNHPIKLTKPSLGVVS